MKFLIFLIIFNLYPSEEVLIGRISKINIKAELIRVRFKNSNIKFLNKKDRLLLWGVRNKNLVCRSFVVGKSSRYLLLRVPSFDECLKNIGLNVGGIIHLKGQDFSRNLKYAYQVIDILEKKRLAIESKLNNEKKNQETYLDKVETVNKRFEVLKKKLELDWQKALTNLEAQNTISLRNTKIFEIELNKIHLKLQKYKIYDEDMRKDRWAIDNVIYQTK